MSAPRRQNIGPKAVEIIRRIYEHSGVGCCWHVVLDDGNWDSIDFCRRYVQERCADCRTHGACAELAALDVSPSILGRAMRTIGREQEAARDAQVAAIRARAGLQ